MNKKVINYKKTAIFSLGIFIVIASLILVKEVVYYKSDSKAEVLSLGNIKTKEYKENNQLIASYKKYKSFLKKYDIKGNLNSKDFNKNDYILSLQPFSKENEKTKVNEILYSEMAGIEIVFDKLNYCDSSKNIELLAYLIPVTKGNVSSSNIKVHYNKLDKNTCNKEK
ncbi:MAG: hypothetical protein RSB77_05225 [Bacilli bacterium]